MGCDQKRERERETEEEKKLVTIQCKKTQLHFCNSP